MFDTMTWLKNVYVEMQQNCVWWSSNLGNLKMFLKRHKNKWMMSLRVLYFFFFCNTKKIHFELLNCSSWLWRNFGVTPNPDDELKWEGRSPQSRHQVALAEWEMFPHRSPDDPDDHCRQFSTRHLLGLLLFHVHHWRGSEGVGRLC